MKRFLRFAALLSALALLGACDDDMYVTPLEVTNNNIAGTWQLAEWNGAPLAEGSFVYIEFIRKDAKYVMYQNLDSFGTRKLTGPLRHRQRRGAGCGHPRQLRLRRQATGRTATS